MGDTETGSWTSRELGGFIRREDGRKMDKQSSTDRPSERNPLQFEDVALAAAIRWAVDTKSALNYFKTNFQTPAEALKDLRANLNSMPDKFWESL